MIRIPNRRHLRAIVRRFLARRGWLVRQRSGGESRDVWKVGPLCVKRWQPAIPAAIVRAKCHLSRRHTDFARRWYLPWLHWSIGWWIEGRPANFEECNALACRHPWVHDLNPSNVVATVHGLKIVDYEVVHWPPDAFEPGRVRRVAGHIWQSIRIARLSGGGESRDIWKLGPLCLKRWSPRVTPIEVRERCRISRSLPVCNSTWYIPWLHWTIARWVHGEPASHGLCNSVLASYYALADLHPANVVATKNGPVIFDFSIKNGTQKLAAVSAAANHPA
jgi:hypothetical protein